jgi:hypothetical protein
MATPCYKERMKAARARARAKREAEKAAWQRRAELIATARTMALDAVKLTIRDRGDKISLYTPAQLRAKADAMMGPWLILKAKGRIAERNSTNLHKSRRADLQRLSLCKCQVQNGELNHRSPRAGFRRQANARRATGDSASRPRRSSLIQAEIAE